MKGHAVPQIPRKQTISYSIETSDLRNYLNAGGTMFFVVYVDETGTNHRIFYTSLLPYTSRTMPHAFDWRDIPLGHDRRVILPIGKAPQHNAINAQPAAQQLRITIRQISNSVNVHAHKFPCSGAPNVQQFRYRCCSF